MNPCSQVAVLVAWNYTCFNTQLECRAFVLGHWSARCRESCQFHPNLNVGISQFKFALFGGLTFDVFTLSSVTVNLQKISRSSTQTWLTQICTRSVFLFDFLGSKFVVEIVSCYEGRAAALNLARSQDSFQAFVCHASVWRRWIKGGWS